MKKRFIYLYVYLFVCLFTGSANAATILDTASLAQFGAYGFGNSTGSVTSTFQNPLGQSFILTSDTNNIQIGAVLGDNNGSKSHDFTISLVAGAGTGGAVLGSITFTELFNGSGDSHMIAMKDFSSVGTLSAGTYTAVFSGVAGNFEGSIGYSVSGGDPLSNPYNSLGQISISNDPSRDFLVRVTGNISTVPVPATAWLFGSGLLGLIGIARKGKSISS